MATSATTTADLSGKPSTTGPIIVTTITSLPGVSMSANLSTSEGSILRAQTSASISRGDMITPTLTISNEDATTTSFTISDTASPSCLAGVRPSDGTSGRLEGLTILGIILGAAAFFSIALGLAFWRRRRSRDTATRQMKSQWMDRWSDSMTTRRMARTRETNGGATASVVLGVDSIQQPPPSTERKRPKNLDTSKSKADVKTDASTRVPSPLTTPPPSATSTYTLIRSTNSPKSFAFTITGTESGGPPKATVMYTFVSKLPDELVVTIGDQLAIIREFDDGWALCVDAFGKQGVVPVECVAVIGPLDRIREEVETDLDDIRLRRRGSSLEPPPKVQ